MTTSSFSSSELISLILTSLPSDIAHAELSVTTVSTCCHKRCVYFPAVSVSVACQPNRFIFISIFGNNSMGIPRKAILPFISRKFFSYYNQRQQYLLICECATQNPPTFHSLPSNCLRRRSLFSSYRCTCSAFQQNLYIHFALQPRMQKPINYDQKKGCVKKITTANAPPLGCNLQPLCLENKIRELTGVSGLDIVTTNPQQGQSLYISAKQECGAWNFF